MSNRSSRRGPRPAADRSRSGARRWLPLSVAAAAVVLLLLGGLLWANRSGSQPSGAEQGDPGRVAAARVKGDPQAPVEVEEWGDFQ
jgi:hypothetical protein